MPVYKLLDEMPYEELLEWGLYFQERPIGWREDQRTAMLLNAAGVKEKPHKLFSSLAQMKKNEERKPESERLRDSLITSGLLARLQTAAANNNVDWKVNQNGTDTDTGNSESKSI
jgi:hypothetical protein